MKNPRRFSGWGGYTVTDPRFALATATLFGGITGLPVLTAANTAMMSSTTLSTSSKEF